MASSLFASMDSDCKICLMELQGDKRTSCIVLNRCSESTMHGFHTNCLKEWTETKKETIKRITTNGGVLESGIFNVMCAACCVPLDYLKEMADAPKFVMNAKTRICKEARTNSINMLASPQDIESFCLSVENPVDLISPENEALGYQIARCSTMAGCITRWFVKRKGACCAEPQNAGPEYCYDCEENRRKKITQVSSDPALAWMKNIIRCDMCGDSDPTFIERISECSHLKCTKCNKFEGCAVCGGEYNKYMTFPTHRLRSQPYCARPEPGAVNLEGQPRRVGKCLCEERYQLENQRAVNDFKNQLAPRPEKVLYGVASFATNPDQANPYVMMDTMVIAQATGASGSSYEAALPCSEDTDEEENEEDAGVSMHSSILQSAVARSRAFREERERRVRPRLADAAGPSAETIDLTVD